MSKIIDINYDNEKGKEKTALKNSILISEAADKQYNNGEINYLSVMCFLQKSNIITK